MKKNNINMIKKVIIFISVIAALIVMIMVTKIGYARYTETFTGKASGEVAKMICEMEVVTNENSEEILINPYFKLKVKNYNLEGDITETDVDYKIEVLSNDGKDIPEYHWETSDGIELYTNSECTGSFSKEMKEETEYTIVFANSGEDEILRKIKFNLVATQVNK